MFFSIVLPVYNRERLLRRCLASLFSQDFGDFEIIAVDDGSTDASLTMLRSAADARLTVIDHGQNRGVGPARNTAIAAAKGDWIVPLDSDDELVPGALLRMNRLALSVPDTVHALWFRCRMDDGRVSPDPPPRNAEWDYHGYIAFLAESRRRWRDMLRCVRRQCFERVRYPEDRMLEDKFHLDFAREFRSRGFPDVLRLYHQDAENSLVARLKMLDPSDDAPFLRDQARGFRALLCEHGEAIRRISPPLHGDYLQMSARSALLAGERKAALCTSLRLMAGQPWRAAGWKLLAASLAGPGIALRLRRRFA